MSSEQAKSAPISQPQQPSLIGLLSSYRGLVIVLVLLAMAANGLNLLLPKLVARSIDSYVGGHFVLKTMVTEFALAIVGVFIFTVLQSIVQTYVSERVARDVRRDVAAKISRQTYSYIQEATPGKLLTNLTSDIDSVKTFISQAVVSIVSSLVLIIGTSVLLLLINWKLALAVLTIIPLIGGTFFFVLRKVRVLFVKSREVIDWLNKVINESILGAALIRVLNSRRIEDQKFSDANTRARDLGFQILALFSGLIPAIGFVANLATLVILALGGHFVIGGSMSLGDFAAFNSYVLIIIFPIILIGFMSNVIAQASASYGRISVVLGAPEKHETGTNTDQLRGDIDVEHVTVRFGDKAVLRDVSFYVAAGNRTAIIGPTAAGKTQLLHVLIGLFAPESGAVLYDGREISQYDLVSLHRQIGFVFQDSVLFNLSLRENIGFGDEVAPADMDRAIATAELADFIAELPQGLDTIVSERGTSLSGGQKQRIMLARALALNPRVLLLDDFTARVDRNTEERILANIKKEYPNLTLVSVTQKIASVGDYDQIVLMLEGEIVATGTHKELLATSPEYVQIYNSQQSTHHYELQS